jgi:hypothetical protein
VDFNVVLAGRDLEGGFGDLGCYAEVAAGEFLAAADGLAGGEGE